MPDYRRDLVTVKVAGVRVVHNGESYAEISAPPKLVLVALDNEIRTLEDRVLELKSARSAVVKDLRSLR